MDLTSFLKTKQTSDIYGILPGAFPTFQVASIARNNTTKILYIAPNEGRSREILDELSFFMGNSLNGEQNPRVDHLPWIEGSVYNEILPERYAIGKRMASLARLLYDKSGIVTVTGIESLARKVIPVDVFDEYCHLLGPNLSMERESLAKILLESGYERVDTVEEPASFSMRGQVMDIFIPMYSFPARIIFFDDEIEEIWFFDPSTQKRTVICDELLVHPARETILSDKENIRQRLYKKADEVSHPSTKTRYLLERIFSHEDFFGMETLTPLYHSHMTSALDYFPSSIQIIFENPLETISTLKTIFEREDEKYNTLKNEKRVVFPPESFYDSFENIEKSLQHFPTLRFFPSSAPEDNLLELNVKGFTDLSMELKRARINDDEPMAPLKEKIIELLEGEFLIFVAVPEDPLSSPMVKILQDEDFVVNTIPSNESAIKFTENKKGIYALRGNISSGFESPSHKIALFSEEEFFGRKTKRSTRGRKKFVSDISDAGKIESGDYIVHKIHGIGKYQGIKKMNPGGIWGEYLLIEYLGGDKLYLPAHRVSVISRYRGGTSENVHLDKLGGKSFEKRKKKVSESAKGLAEKLLKLAADRKDQKGTAFPSDDPMLYEFEAAFPFEETEDQRQSIDMVYNDMQSPYPMDRLICGDVGYGKTEVALRAAFLAALGGKQVALLAPTTLLVEQHKRTFSDRLSSFPVTVAAMSRFQSSTKQKETLAGVASGAIDILIGTHRILGKDIYFKDLGLLIIDEEQRFGVAQKEHLKFFKPSLDVLSLSATPIPRTLHMSMMGMKDISIIATPPEDRLAVRTFVAPFSPQMLKEAVHREMSRGGQIFMVVPRVKGKKGSMRTINEWEEFIKDLIPEANAAVAHGRMDPAKLERIMVEFLSGSRKMLISTNIIESGLDISRANTIIVMDAQNFGLSQLYQLRGRVGRGKVRAYGYFFVPSFNKLTDNARKRLNAIQRYSHLGSGFNLASEDLEIRGAGEMLGQKQSGAIAMVGFDAYSEIINEAVHELKDEAPLLINDPEIKTDISGYIPEEYIPDPTERLLYYRRLSTAQNITAVSDHGMLMADKYGPPPEETEILFELMKIKTMLRDINASGINISKRKMVIHMDDSSYIDPQKLLKVMENNKKIIFDGPTGIKVTITKNSTTKERLESVQTHLHTLSNCANN